MVYGVKNMAELTTVNKIAVRPTHVAQLCPCCHGWLTVKHGALPCAVCRDESGKSRGYILVPCEPVNNINA